MSLVDWTLETIAENFELAHSSGLYGNGLYGDGLYYAEDFESAPIRRVNRDQSNVLEDDRRQRGGELQESNFVGAALVSRSTTPLDTAYDHRVEVVIGVRVEGLHVDEFGHVPHDAHFNALVRAIQAALLEERAYPDVDAADPADYHTLLVENTQHASRDHRDYFRADFDVRLVGHETL